MSIFVIGSKGHYTFSSSNKLVNLVLEYIEVNLFWKSRGK